MKLIYLLILIVAICIVLAYIFIRLENTRKELFRLKNKVDTNTKLLEKKKSHKTITKKDNILDKSDTNNLLSISSVSTTSEEISGIEINKNKQSDNLFGGLNIPSIFQMFTSTDFSKLSNINTMAKHPNIPNLESSSDIESLSTSQIKSLSDRSINIDGTKSIKIVNETTGNITNVEIEKIGNVDENIVNNIPITTVTNITTEQINDDATEYDCKDEEHIEVYSNSDNKEVNNSEDKKNDTTLDSIKTGKDFESTDINLSDTHLNNENTLDKKKLENMKVSDLKNLAKKKNINLFIGKKPKNKFELITDILKISSLVNI